MPGNLKKIAMKLPQVVAGSSCNKIAYQAGKKSFLFVGEKDDTYDVMLKLDEHLDEAQLMARQHPGLYNVGAHGWVKVVMPKGQSPPKGLWERWVLESYQLLVPAKIRGQLNSGGKPVGAKKKAARKTTANKKSTKKPMKKTVGRKATAKKAVTKKTVKKKVAGTKKLAKVVIAKSRAKSAKKKK